MFFSKYLNVCTSQQQWEHGIACQYEASQDENKPENIPLTKRRDGFKKSNHTLVHFFQPNRSTKIVNRSGCRMTYYQVQCTNKKHFDHKFHRSI